MDAETGQSGWTATEHRIVAEVVEPMLGRVPHNASQDLVALGADSMTLVHMLVRVEGLFAVEVSPLELMEGVTVAGLAKLVDAGRPD